MEKAKQEIVDGTKELLKDAGIEFKEFNCGVQINAKDGAGTWQVYYPTTGTLILHASNERSDIRMKTFRNISPQKFVSGIKRKDLKNIYFKENEND